LPLRHPSEGGEAGFTALLNYFGYGTNRSAPSLNAGECVPRVRIQAVVAQSETGGFSRYF